MDNSRDPARHQPTARFGRRAANYVRYRPRYPQAVLDAMVERTGLQLAHVVADIGSGTGFSAEMFLRNGNTVYGIEPNAEMRAAGELYLSAYPAFHSIDATAEATTLPAASVDYIVAGQSFHWFDVPRAAVEFTRILRSSGWIAVMWNSRDLNSPFIQEYEALVQRYSCDAQEVYHSNVGEAELRSLFADDDYAIIRIPYPLLYSADHLIGLAYSSSYMPGPDDPAAPRMVADIRALHDRFAHDGLIRYDYVTELYLGRPRSHTGRPST